MYSDKKAVYASGFVDGEKDGEIDVKEFYAKENKARVKEKKLSSVQEFKNDSNIE